MERNLRRKKNKKYPQKPKTVNDVIKAYDDPEIARKFGNNLRNTAQFYIDTITFLSSAFTIFASHQVIDMIKRYIPNDRTYMMEGTFAVVPIENYYQLLIIYIQYKNDVSFAQKELHILLLKIFLSRNLNVSLCSLNTVQSLFA